ncbi:protoporphyrinogen oxidase [Rhodothermus profundi]|uniref:Coproporphyrinogen III oxidase n=1 Tax=Rhodothermus profundi TaxID=633813 RepID=A0A1M6V7K7_9BACT|nr:protoporphyrinogen oxidase [Rhodothermus profundi]SHK77477.1 oxygen-dependent protoporphyrinogen oxidase [Rhodothermus profundi]
MASVGIIGAGIAGLAAAYELHRRGLEVTVFEASDRIGGFIQSERMEGFLVEYGPQTLQRTSADLEELLRRIDLEDACIAAQPVASKRFIVRSGRPIPLPRSPRELLRTPLLSPRARLRLLAEPFIARSHRSTEESVAKFARRRLGPEVLDYLVEPFVAGIFAGNPEHLSIRHAFPKLFELEQQYGSLFWGFIRDRMKQRYHPAPRRSMFSFVEGLHMLPRALADRLPAQAILRNAEVLAIRWDEKNPWTLSFRENGRTATRFFDVIVCATSLHHLAQIRILPPLDRQPLSTVEHPPLALVALGFRREQVAHPLDGFGLLVPAVEREFQILGTLFSSSLFPNRAPEGHVLLTTFVGGMRHPEQALLPDDRLEALVLQDLRRLLGISGPPVFRHIWRWERSIPQYRLGYDTVIACVRDVEMSRPGLFLAGNYREGISVVDALHSGLKAAQQIILHLREEAAGGLAKLLLGD